MYVERMGSGKTRSAIILRNMLVLAVNTVNTLDEKTGAAIQQVESVTLAVNDRQGNLLALADEKGKLKLLLTNAGAGDSTPDKDGAIEWMDDPFDVRPGLVATPPKVDVPAAPKMEQAVVARKPVPLNTLINADNVSEYFTTVEVKTAPEGVVKNPDDLKGRYIVRSVEAGQYLYKSLTGNEIAKVETPAAPARCPRPRRQDGGGEQEDQAAPVRAGDPGRRRGPEGDLAGGGPGQVEAVRQREGSGRVQAGGRSPRGTTSSRTRARWNSNQPDQVDRRPGDAARRLTAPGSPGPAGAALAGEVKGCTRRNCPCVGGGRPTGRAGGPVERPGGPGPTEGRPADGHPGPDRGDLGDDRRPGPLPDEDQEADREAFNENDRVVQVLADATDPTTLILIGRAAGTSRLEVTDADGAKESYLIVVQRDVEMLRNLIREDGPDRDLVEITPVGDSGNEHHPVRVRDGRGRPGHDPASWPRPWACGWR